MGTAAITHATLKENRAIVQENFKDC